MNHHPAWSLCLLLGMAGCGLRQPYVQPEIPVPAAWSSPQSRPDNEGGAMFRDPLLDSLLREALAHSPDLKVAMARLQGAKALERMAGSESWPVVSVNPEAERRKTPLNSLSASTEGDLAERNPRNSFRLPLDVAYEADLWGRTAFARQSASHEEAATRGDLEAARLSLQASVVSAYLDLRFLQGLRGLQDRRIAAIERALAIQRARVQAGLGTSTDVYRQESELRLLQVEVPVLEKELAQTRHRLAVLVGRAPGTLELVLPAGTPFIPDVPAGLPSELLVRRPDIQAAEQRMRAGNARVGEARAAALPRFSLTGNFGFSSNELRDLLKDDATGWSFGPRIQIPIFDGGKNKARKDVAESERQRLEGEYRQVVLKAFEEVENALSNLEADRKARDLFSQVRDNHQILFGKRQQEFAYGRAGGLALAESEAAFLAAEYQFLQAERNRAQDLVQLRKAIGGGWSNGA